MDRYLHVLISGLTEASLKHLAVINGNSYSGYIRDLINAEITHQRRENRSFRVWHDETLETYLLLERVRLNGLSDPQK